MDEEQKEEQWLKGHQIKKKGGKTGKKKKPKNLQLPIYFLYAHINELKVKFTLKGWFSNAKIIL